MVKVALEFTHLHCPTKKLNLEIEILDSSPAQKWIKSLDKAISDHCMIEKNYSFLGLLNSNRDLPFLCSQLGHYIGVINDYFGPETSTMNYHIDQKLTPEILMGAPSQVRILLNEIHHHYEILQGQEWDLSSYWKAADMGTKYAIRQLNQYCHEIEHYLKAIYSRQDSTRPNRPVTVVVLLTEEDPLSDLEENDYEHFDLNLSFGDVFLNYGQSGKTFHEVFEDNDHIVGRDNISALRYLSPSFVIYWGPAKDDRQEVPQWNNEFRKWLIANGENPEDRKLGLGVSKVGRIDIRQFNGATLEEIHQTLGEHANLTRITIHYPTHSKSKDFPEFWTDKGFVELQHEYLYDDEP